ncbi:MAG: hypothetical protein NWE98_04100 [Candidatus Bathyarchaeota archaeon]|nr:hypothetical protein [Candidatus Bathyarchaeota archaeon]
MRLAKVIVGEIILILASVLIFRSLWNLLDQYLGYSYLEVLLLVGLVAAVLALVWINHEVNSKET